MYDIIYKGKVVASNLTTEEVWCWYIKKLRSFQLSEKWKYSAIGADGLVISDDKESWLEWQTQERSYTSRKQVVVEIVSANQLKVGEVNSSITGLGCQATKIGVEGQIAEIMINCNGKCAIGISVLEDGSIVINGHDTSFSVHMSSLRLENKYPWTEENQQA